MLHCNVGRQTNDIQVLCPSVACVHGKPPPTPSTESTFPCKTHPCSETFQYTSGSIEGFLGQEDFNEEMRLLFVLLKFAVSCFSEILLELREGKKNIEGQRVTFQKKELGGLYDRER